MTCEYRNNGCGVPSKCTEDLRGCGAPSKCTEGLRDCGAPSKCTEVLRGRMLLIYGLALAVNVSCCIYQAGGPPQGIAAGAAAGKQTAVPCARCWLLGLPFRSLHAGLCLVQQWCGLVAVLGRLRHAAWRGVARA